MAYNPLIYCKISDEGKIRINPISKGAYQEQLNRLKGKEVIMRLQKDKPLRSNPQNKYYWGVIVQGLADEFGMEPEECHDALRWRFLKDNTKKIPTTKSTTQLTTDEFEDYCERIRRWAGTEMNTLLPLPGEVDLDSIFDN